MRCSLESALVAVLLIASSGWAGPARAQTAVTGDGNVWSLRTSVYTQHFSPSPDHNNQQGLINLEVRTPSDRVAGFATFSNSFHQPAQIAYVGKIWDFERWPGLNFKLVGGLIHGYHGEYRDKIPFNRYGIAPLILPALGYSRGPFNAELVLFGTAGLMITIGYNAR